MATHKQPKIGIALGSGGAKGLAHIGVLKTLNKYHIPIHYIAGTSAGALAGALYSVYQDTEKIEKIIYDFSTTQGLGLIDFTISGGLMKGKKAQIYIENLLGGDSFDNIHIPLAIVATDITTAEAVVFTTGNLAKAIRASISVPAFFQPVSYQHHLLADGGLSNPVPVDVLKTMGADITIAVNLDAVYGEETNDNLPPLSLIPMRSVNLLRHSLGKQSIKEADVIIEPPDIYHIGLFGWKYVFDNEKAKSIIELGEQAGEKAIPEIEKAIKQYHRDHSRANRFFAFFHKARKTLLR